MYIFPGKGVKPMQIKFKWKQQSRQMTFLRACGLSHALEGGTPKRAAAKVIAYGGAAGGGKSDAMCMLSIIACLTYLRSLKVPGVPYGEPLNY
jgi:hypothetical protein